MPETPYDASFPPGPVGLPEHIEVSFTPTNPAVALASVPILYVIPVDAYVALWGAAGNDAVARTMQRIYDLSVALPQPAPTAGMPVLPYDQAGAGYNDVAAQVGGATVAERSATKSGYRFAGRFAQDANPVTNQGLRWYYQGFTNDSRYLVAFFNPVVTFALPLTAQNLSPEAKEAFSLNSTGTIEAQTGMLNELAATNWSPGLAQFDALVGSLTIEGMRPDGLRDTAWQLVARALSAQAGGAQQPLANTAQYRLGYQPDGTLVIQADCNRVGATYQAAGGVYGSVTVQPGPSTLAACPPGSYDQELLLTVFNAQNYKLRPGGNEMELIKPAAGGSLVFRYLGTADAA